MEGEGNPTKRRVLVLDDEQAVRELTANLIEKAGFVTVQARTCDEARAHLYNGGKIDLLFSDIGTEGRFSRGGFDLAVELRKARHYLFENPEFPRVVLATGSLENEIGILCNVYNIPVLQKPYSFPKLKATIANRLGC